MQSCLIELNFSLIYQSIFTNFWSEKLYWLTEYSLNTSNKYNWHVFLLHTNFNSHAYTTQCRNSVCICSYSDEYNLLFQSFDYHKQTVFHLFERILYRCEFDSTNTNTKFHQYITYNLNLWHTNTSLGIRPDANDFLKNRRAIKYPWNKICSFI